MKFESILEPQLASQPLARKMSLCAMGTPVRACARPAARARSASAACAIVLSSSSATKQLYFGFNALMRRRKPSVASTLESFLAASASDRDLSVRSCMAGARLKARAPFARDTSLDDLGHEVEPALH